MRRWTDGSGRAWDVVAGRESWGAFFAIFVPRAEGTVRQAPLEAESVEEASRALAELDDDGLERLLADSEPKEIA